MKTELEKLPTKENDEETYKFGKYVIHIARDNSPESPRRWSNLWSWFSNMRDFRFNGENDGNIGSLLGEQDSRECRKEGETVTQAMLRLVKEANPDCYCAPIFAYQHSGLALSLAPFSDSWDSGTDAVALCKKAHVKEWFPNLDEEKWKGKALEILKAEVDAMQRYLDGNVYGYWIEDPSGEEVGACWGFYADPEDVAKDAAEDVPLEEN